MMDLKVICALVSCFFIFIMSSYATDKKIQLSGELRDRDGLRSSGRADSFVIGSLDGKILDLEFFDEADDLTIEVWGNDGVCVFSETTDVIAGLHIIVDLSSSEAWAFEVYIYNEETGTFLITDFEMP